MNWGLSRSWAAVLETLGARRQPARGSWSSSVTEGQKHINHRKWAPRIFQKPLKYYIFHSIFIRVTLNNNNNKITYLILYEGLALQQSILNHCSWLQHPLSDCWLKSWPLRFWFSFLLTNLGRQQEAAQVPGPLAPMAETQMNPVFLASAWLSSGCLTTWGVRGWRFFSIILPFSNQQILNVCYTEEFTVLLQSFSNFEDLAQLFLLAVCLIFT